VRGRFFVLGLLVVVVVVVVVLREEAPQASRPAGGHLWLAAGRLHMGEQRLA